jgi:hypothetical protein
MFCPSPPRFAAPHGPPMHQAAAASPVVLTQRLNNCPACAALLLPFGWQPEGFQLPICLGRPGRRLHNGAGKTRITSSLSKAVKCNR